MGHLPHVEWRFIWVSAVDEVTMISYYGIHMLQINLAALTILFSQLKSTYISFIHKSYGSILLYLSCIQHPCVQ